MIITKCGMYSLERYLLSTILVFLHCDMYPLSSLMFGWANVIFDVTLKNNGLILRFVRHYFKSASMPTTSYQRSILIMISFCIMTVILSHLWDVQCRKILTFYKWRWTITSRSLRVVSFDRLCIISRSFFSIICTENAPFFRYANSKNHNTFKTAVGVPQDHSKFQSSQERIWVVSQFTFSNKLVLSLVVL